MTEEGKRREESEEDNDPGKTHPGTSPGSWKCSQLQGDSGSYMGAQPQAWTLQPGREVRLNSKPNPEGLLSH